MLAIKASPFQIRRMLSVKLSQLTPSWVNNGIRPCWANQPIKLGV